MGVKKTGLIFGLSLIVGLSLILCFHGRFVSASINDFPIPNELKSPSGIQNLDFNQGSTLEKLTQDWSDASPKQKQIVNEEELTYEKTKTNLLILNQNFKGNLRRNGKNQFDLVFASTTIKNVGDFKKTLLLRAKQLWGDPAAEVDTSNKSMGFYVYSYKAQWNFHSTVINLYIWGSNEQFSLVGLSFGHVQNKLYSKLFALIPLRCKGQYQTYGAAGSQPLPQQSEMIFVLDLNMKKILDQNYRILGDLTLIREDLFEAKWIRSGDQEIYNADLRINRITGAYTLDFAPQKPSPIHIQEQGNCERISLEELKPKF